MALRWSPALVVAVAAPRSLASRVCLSVQDGPPSWLRPLQVRTMSTEPTLRDAMESALFPIAYDYGHAATSSAEMTDAILAATYPPACPIWPDGHDDAPEPDCNLCDSFGRSGCSVHAGTQGFACPDCPTFGKLLAIGVAVMRTAPLQPPIASNLDYIDGWNDCIDTLRAIHE